jgi:hypothetical protein
MRVTPAPVEPIGRRRHQFKTTSAHQLGDIRHACVNRAQRSAPDPSRTSLFHVKQRGSLFSRHAEKTQEESIRCIIAGERPIHIATRLQSVGRKELEPSHKTFARMPVTCRSPSPQQVSRETHSTVPGEQTNRHAQRSSTLLRRIPGRGHRTRSQAPRPNRVASRRSANRLCKSPFSLSPRRRATRSRSEFASVDGCWITDHLSGEEMDDTAMADGSARASLRMFHVKLAGRQAPVAHETSPVAQAPGRSGVLQSATECNVPG